HTWGNRVTVPGAASLNIEYELASRGCDAFGFTAQVPHYVAASEYPLASLRLLQEVAKLAKLELPLEALEKESARVAELLNTQTN
ncbi:PAC2 family protein, partial [Escherichia coli]|nr:PAC2 family protein [Escherichia coli]